MGWVIVGCHSKVKCFEAQSVSLSGGGGLPLLFPHRACLLTELLGEAAARIDPEGGQRDRRESVFCREKEDSLVIVKMHASEGSL